MVIMWTTMQALNNPSTVPQVVYGVNPFYLKSSSNASINKFVYNGGQQYIYTATLQNLTPATRYYYQVGSTEGWSSTWNFTTFPSGNNFPYTIAIFGDLGMTDGASYPFLKQGAANNQFDIVFHIGDFAYNLFTNGGKVGDEWMREMQEIMATKPYMVIAGNHEWESDQLNFTNYRNRFSVPINNAYNDSQFYSFNVGPVHYVGISSEYYFYENIEPIVNAQYQWLVNDLKTADSNRQNQPWIIAGQHRPYYSSEKENSCCNEVVDNYVNYKMKDGDSTVPGLEKPYLDNAVDMVFWGHVHSYERTYPVANMTAYKDGNPYHNPKAPVYICTGGAGSQEGHTNFKHSPSPWSAQRIDRFGYTLLHVYNNTHLYMEQIDASNNGTVMDSVWITKDQGFQRNFW
uniref:Purple acid phosphatase n=1 Tax=Acrobeloides nanus TaxID=290746 RepID=A0A914DI15_9BILA